MSIQLPPGFKWETPPADEAPKAQARPALPDGFKWEAAAPSIAEPPSFTGAVAKGFKRSLPETKSLLAGAGAAAAGAVGLDGVRDKLLDTYQGIQQNEVAPLQAKTGFIDAVTGDGSLKEWAGDTLGNFGGQALQSVAAAGAGALVGSAVPGAGTVAGGVGGLLFKAGAKEMVTDAVGRMVAKGVAKDVAEKTALRRLGGAAIAGTGLNVGQEIGTGYTGRAEDAKQSGEQLTQTDALRAIGYGIPAGLVDTAAEALTGSRLMRGVSDSPKMLSRMAKGAGIGAVSEGATEGVQAVLERAGANQALTGDAAYRDYIENIAAGALGGGVAGAGGGFRRQQDPAAPPPPETPLPPMTPEVNASQAVPPAPSPLATPPVGPMTRAAATVPGAPPLATPPATTAADTAQTPTDALPPLIADTAGQAVAAPPAADPVFEKAKELLAAAGKVNRKQLRADLGIKENQMQTLLDQLHAAGIVGPSNGKKARKLLVNPITGDVLDPDEKARLDRKVQRDAEQKALEEAVRGGKPAAAIEAAAAAQGQQPEVAQTPSPLSRPPMTPEFEAKMRERQAAALTRAQRPDPATGATSKAAAVAFDTGAAALAEQQSAQAAQDQQAQAAVTAQAEADKVQQQQQKLAEKAAKEADKAARQAEKDRVQAEKTAPAQDVDIQAVVAAEIDAGKPMDGMRMHALAKKLNVTPKRIDEMRMALAQKRKRGEPLTAPTADAVQNLDPIAQGVQNVDTQDQFAEPSKMVDQYDDSPDVTEDDITPPSGGAFSIRSAAESTAKRTPGGRVFEVDGGFVVRTPRAVVNESLTTAPDPGLEDALRQERDAYTNERDDAYLNKTKHARDPLKDAVEDAVNASVLDPDAARVVLDVALSNGRVDLAEYAVSRAERAVAGMSVTPGVPQNSPKYADIKAALESRKREATALLDSLKKDLAAAKTATVKESLTVGTVAAENEQQERERADNEQQVAMPELSAHLESGQLPTINSEMADGKTVWTATAVKSTDKKHYLRLDPTKEERKAATVAESDIALADTQEEREAAKLALRQALLPATKRAVERAKAARAALTQAQPAAQETTNAKQEAPRTEQAAAEAKPEALLSEKPAAGLSTAALEAFLKPAAEALRKDGVQIHVITTAQLGESTGDAAEDARREAMKRGMGNKKSRASVSGDRQHVYFFADKIKTIEEAGRVAAHELVGHIGMERLLGGRWAELRAAVLRLRDAGKWPELFDEVRARYASNPDGTARGMDDDTFAAEAIAVFAERNVKTNILQAAMVAARGWLRRTFPNQEIEISQDELRQLVWEAGRMVKGKRFRSGVVEDVLGSAEPAAGSDVNPADLARALKAAKVEPAAEPAKPSGTMARQRMPRADAVAEVQRQLKVTKKRATEIVNEIRSEAKNLDGVTYNLKPGIVQTADVQAAIERERAAAAAPAKPEAPLTVGDQATAAIPAAKRRLREARNRGDAKAEAEIERELRQLRAKVWDESPLPKPEDAPAPAQQALQESEWDQIVSTHKLRLQQEHGIASRTAGNPVSWQYMKEPQRAKLAADVRAIIANGGIDPQVDGTPAPAKPEKGIVGRRADGVMIREDERGVRWYAQGGVRIFETVSMRPTRQGMQIDRGVLQREFMTAEESAAAAKAAAPTEQPKAKPAPSANTIVTDADAEAARARLKAKFTRLNSGIDPEMMLDGITLGMYHIERGARTFAAYAKAMVEDLGDAVKPYLKSWYMGVKYDPRAAGFDGMDSAASVESAVVDSTPEPEQDSVTEDSTDAAPKPVEPSVRGGDPEGVPVAEGRRERASQPGNAPPDTGNVAPAQPENVEATGASESGGSVGIRGSATDVEGKQEPQGSGNARPGRKGAGGKKPPDAGAGDARGTGRPSVTAPESVSPANPGPGNFHIANPLEVVGGGQVARFNKNKAAIELFVALRDEGRRPTREEQEVLAGYTGWGSFGQDLFQGSWAHPQPKQGWEQRDQWLRDHLGKSDWEGLQRSITNAHYTDPPTVMAMWEMVRRMGFKGGRVLEPGMGIGNFFGMMPLDLKERSKLAGIELDPVTGGMAQMLYPDAAIKVMGYQDSKTPDDFYDLVIGNWPFENTPVADRRYNRLNPMLHDYFFLKTLDQVRPGGIVIGITSAGSMDKKGTVVRRELAKKAELLASFRLPSGAFEDYAGTKVVTDIIVLRKRPEPASNVDGEAWVDTVEMDTPAGEKVRVNAYYQQNPQNVVGTIDYGHGTTTFRPGLIVHRPENMQAQLDRIVSMIPEGAYLAATRPDAVSYIANHTSDREGALTRTDAGLFVVRGEHLAPAHEVLKYQVKSQKDTAAREAQLNALIDMRKSYGQLIEAERGTSGAAPEPIRTQLRERYEAFVKAYGPMSESFGLGYLERIDDPFYYALAALETKDGKTYRPAAILSQSTIRSAKRITNPSIRDAFVLARNGNVNPSLEDIAEIAKQPADKVRAELVESGAVFETPGGDIVPSDMYLSGNVREKLRQAKVALADGNDAMQRNVAALEKVQPADIPYFNIEVQMGATWVPTRAYEQFVAHMLNRSDTDGISANYTMGRWKVTVDSSLQRSTEAQTGFGTRYYRFGKLVNAAISNQTVVIKERDRDGREFVDQAATDEINAKIADMREKFGDWLWSDAERRIEIEREYNEVRNAYASPSFDGSFLNFDGMALSVGRGPFDLRQHQVNAIWRALVMRRSLNAHEVGTGKTFTMGGIAVESRRYGIAKKPVLLAHNANSKSVASEIQMMYPAAKVLYIDNLSPKAIDVRLRQIANDDWDLIVLPHSLIERLSFREETLMAMAREEIEALEAEARLAASDDGQNFTDAMLSDPDELKKLRSPTAKELVKARARIIETIKKQAQQSSREGAVPFEDLGIDMVLVDEAHEFKKPPIATRMKMKGLQTQSSLGSIQLSFLTRYVREQNNGGNIHLFTGTPITNTLTEIFHQMRYIMADEMAAVGVDQWDGWFGSFAKEVQDVELTAAGDYEAVNRLRGFVNVPELRKMVGQYMDVVFSDDMPEMQPRRTASGKLLADQSLTEQERAELLNGRTEGAKDRPYKKVVNETADPTPDQMRIFEEVQSLANEWRNMGGKARRDAMSAGLPVVPIVYEQLAARASFDARMEDDEALAGKEGNVPDHPDSKVSRAIRNLLEIYRSDTRATQVVFTNTGLGTTANRALRDATGGAIKDADGVTLRRQVKVFSPIRDMVERLVQQGIPRSEIEIVDGSTSKDRRKEVADAMNAGTIRIVIGSTQSLGVGVNMQRNLRAMHHLDAPWMPGDLEQRNGRGHRQGNQWNTVMEYRYITDRIDGRRWQVLAIKQKFITDFLKADGETRVIEGDAASDEESDIISTFAEAAGDPRVLVRQKLVAQVEQLQKRERLHTQGVADAKSTARNARDGLVRQRAEIDRIEQSGAEQKAAKAVSDHAGDKFRMTVDGVEFSERKAANEAIGKFIGANMRTGADPMRIGSYGGLPLHVAWPRFYEAPVFVAVVAGEEVATGAASVASLESSLRAYTTTVDKLRARIQPALETIQRLDEVAGQKFQRADQLKRAEQQLLNLEKDIQLNPVPPPAWLRNGAAIDTEVRWNGTAFVVTGHRWNGAGWFVIAQDAKGGEVVIPYLDVKDAQGMPLYEAREFKAPIVHAKKDEAPKDGTGPTLETVVQTNVSNAEPAPPGQPAAGIESTPARTMVSSRPYFRNLGGEIEHEQNAKKIELSEMPDGEFYIAPGLGRDSGQFEIMEATTGLRVGLGKTRKAAIEAANKAIVENRATIKTALEQRAFPKDKLDAAIAKLDGGNRASFAKADKPNAPGARGMPEKNLTRLLATAKQAMALLGVNIEVVANGSDLPAEITAQDDYDDTVQAAITGDRKTVYFVASRIASPRAAMKLVAHELVGHMSMEQLLGKRWPELRDAILRLRDNGKWPEVFAEVSRRYERNADGTFRPLDDATFAAEAIAVFAERNIQTSILQRAVNSVRAWLRRLGFAMDMSQGELRQMLWEAGQKLEGRAYRAAVVDDVLGAKVEPKQMSMREAVQRYSFGKDDETPELKAQFDATARAYGGEQAWQRAKDSGRTKLNYVQWVQVRTPAFKAWFGDWEATAHRAFLDGAPVSELTGDEFKPDGVPLTTKVPEWYAKQKVASVEVDGIGAVALDVQAVKNSMSHGIGRDKVAAFAAVPDVLRLGKIVHREQMRGSNVGMVYHVAAPISIGGQEFVADVLVKADENTRRMYVHEVAVKEKLQQSVFKTGAVAAEAGKLAGTDAGAIRSVLQGIYAVNPDTVSKVIDQTTGEPLAANFAKAQPAPDDKAAFAKAGTLVDRLGTQMNPHGDPSVLDWIKNRLSAMRPAALGALTLRMLGEVAEKILPSVARYSGVVQLMDTMRKELQELGQDVVKASMDYQAKNSAEAREMFSMLHDATLEGVDPSQRQVAEMPDGTLKFIDDATPKQIEKLKDAGATIKRGQFHEPLMMVSEDYKTNVPVTEASVKAFIKVMRKQMKLNPGSAVAYMNREKEARKLRAQERKRIKSHMDMVPRFNALSDDGKKLWGQMRDAYRTQSNKYLEALLSRIDSLNLDKSKKAEQIARMRMKFESSRVPFYVPLARWGNYWVSGTNDKGKREFYMQESPTAQDEVIRDLTARGFTKIGKGVKLDTVRAQDGASATFMADIDDMLVKSGAPDKIRDEAFQLYLAALPDLSMRKAFIHRKGTRGYSEDAPRALAAHIFHGSFQIARLRYSHELEALRVEAEKESKAMSDEAHEEAVAAGHIVNELKKRHEWVMNPQDNALLNKISSLGFVYYLGLTPASALVNLLATPMVALPILAATGNWASASKHLWRAFKESAGSYGHMEKVLTNEDEIAAHKEFERRGVLDRSQVHNLAGIAESDSFAYSPKWHKTMTIISHMFHKAEVVNREATTMASYRMQREAGIGHEEAMNLAEQQTYEAHLDYSNANRARFMQSGTAKVLLMFRQYSLGMTWLIGRNLWKSDLLGGALGGKTDKAELREARRKVAGILGMTAIFSGTLGLPIIGTVGAVLNAVAAAFGDDDEPWDWETEFRAFLREMLGETGAEAVLRGPVQAATGVGISNRVSMGDLWFREPDRELEGRAWSNYLFEQAAGPMGGLITNFFRGQQLMGEGQVWRGVETMMPKAIKDAMKSLRYLDEGVNNLRGDAIVEDLNVFESLAQIAGFAPASVANAYDTARDVKNYEQAILNRRARLMDAFALAWRLGDVEAREAVLGKMRKFSQTYPELSITGDSIRRSLMQRAKASAQADNGVIVDKRIRARLEGQLGLAQ